MSAQDFVARVIVACIVVSGFLSLYLFGVLFFYLLFS